MSRRVSGGDGELSLGNIYYSVRMTGYEDGGGFTTPKLVRCLSCVEDAAVKHRGSTSILAIEFDSPKVSSNTLNQMSSVVKNKSSEKVTVKGYSIQTHTRREIDSAFILAGGARVEYSQEVVVGEDVTSSDSIERVIDMIEDQATVDKVAAKTQRYSEDESVVEFSTLFSNDRITKRDVQYNRQLIMSNFYTGIEWGPYNFDTVLKDD